MIRSGIAAALCVSILAARIAVAGTTEEAPRIEDFRTALEQHAKAIRSLRVESTGEETYTDWEYLKVHFPELAKLKGEPPESRRTVWAKSGDKIRWVRHSKQISHGYLFDGRTSHVVYRNPQLQIELADSQEGIDQKSANQESPLKPLGVNNTSMDPPLIDLLKDPHCRLEGRAEVDGVQCWKVVIPPMEGSHVVITAFFDPAHSNLPRKIEKRRIGEQKGFPKDWQMTWRVVEFRKIADADGKTSLWFPWQFDFIQRHGTWTEKVTKLELNSTVPDVEFTPESELQPKDTP